MIVVSLLLILVAVTLLVLGLAGGSSTLLISSIVASLLAAVALVVGARQAGAGRRTVGEPLLTDDTHPTTDTAYAEAPAHAGAGAARRGAGPADRTFRSLPDDEPDPDRIIREAFAGTSRDSRSPAGGDSFAGSGDTLTGSAEGDGTDRAADSGAAPGGSVPSDSEPFTHSEPSTHSEPDRAAAYAAGQRDTEAGLTGTSRAAGGPGPEVTQRVEPDTGPAATPAPGDVGAGADRAPYSGTDADRTATGRRAAADRVDSERAAADPAAPDWAAADQAVAPGWAAADRTAAPDWAAADQAAAPGWAADQAAAPDWGAADRAAGPDWAAADRAAADRAAADRAAGDRADVGDYDQASSMIGGARAAEDESWRRARSDAASDREESWQRADGEDGPAREEPWQRAGGEDGPAREDEPWRAEAVAGAESAEAGGSRAGAAGEFDEADPDDPDDEPLPQKVRPSDAVRVARMDAEVVVVDGRPRYHLAGCAHLSGRQTEALPVAEAVELGFGPCGLCRPVDHLVAASVR
ncbi:hypothetical protein AB0368_23250 [Actinoplanes sp. NPDC051475]|uniref:hypothetical protein n=1 Tax=Actinoplanes sp. NPDC051475 TaxID=3157225 RepID=UPI00344C0B0C